MNLNQLTFRLGGILAIVTLILFFGLYVIFSMNAKITDADYFNYSSLINCFVLPAIYASVGFYSIFKRAKINPVTFGQGFKYAFLPQAIGGFISLGIIFIFLNTSGQWVEDSLQRGWYNLMMQNPNPEFLEKNKEFVESMKDTSINMFTGKVFFYAFSMILFFYLLISSIFAVFFKNRRV